MLWWRGRKEKELATTSLEYEYLLRKSRCEMLIGIMTSLPLARVFQCLFTFVLVSTSRWLAEIWHSSWRNATGELEVEFKFQGHSCKLSFLFLPYHQSALESLFAGYWMCSYYMYTYSLHTVSGTSFKGVAKCVHDSEVLLYKGYFTITGAKNIVRYTKDFVIWRFILFRFHCMLSEGFFFKQSKRIQQTILCL